MTTRTDILDLMQTRRSLRRYTSQPVPRDLLEDLLTAAIWAPSAHNRQPWRFVVIESAAQKEALALAMGARLRQELEVDHVPEDIIEADVSRSYQRLTGAPVIVVMCLTMNDMDSYPDSKRQQAEYTMTVQSVAMAGQNLLLCAHTAGLGACWVCAPLFCGDVVLASLNLPDDWEPQGLITLGFPAQTREKSRRPLEASVLWR